MRTIASFSISAILFILVYACNAPRSELSEAELAKGKKHYATYCQSCHMANGEGQLKNFPPLYQTGWVTGSKERLINVVLKGLQEKIRVHGVIYDGVMPAQANLSDEELSQLLSYIRTSFGNEASHILPNEVKKVRAGESLNEPLTDFADVAPVTDFDARKKAAGKSIESKPGSHFEKGTVLTEKIYAPEGFKVDVFASGLQNPRSLAIGPKGTVFVGSRRNDSEFIYAILDQNKDWKPDTIIQISRGLKWNPMGVAMLQNDLYVGEIDRIVKYENIEDHLFDPPEPTLVFNYPPVKKHGDKYIRFGPDGKLYVPVGAPCNNCIEENPVFASITRINSDGSGFEIYANGVRNSRGFDWHPETGELWFSDNGRDLLGDDLPPCEVNIAKESGQHYGFPYCHGSNVSDPEFGTDRPCSDFTPSTFNLVAHAAPVSLKFYTGTQFPEAYRGNILIAEHGSWNRSEKVGYRVMRLVLEGDEVVSYEPFLTGWLDEENDDAWGRPVDILQMPDGSLLLSDDYSGTIYRISYSHPNT
jgi:glucose/arabinose dehydrogenase/mono/diheme cytochrome c family protein